ncbi:SIR2 family NAD-dependent protein deacylase, partial [Enterococcus faecalis]|uniref:SIR2 family NAD-dependent protein deacylase n=1 Tax=Enterococcus faecalis TaxID=1351 RepID=UPI0011786DB8
LTAIDSEQAITLNYDRLFETAAEDAGLPRAVIPGQHEGEHERWLLKLHGTVERPETIVLTRDDYLGYDSSRRALSSIVKATLATRHLLFVGFGLTDDHFHEIVHDVRRAFPASGNGPLATALTLFAD